MSGDLKKSDCVTSTKDYINCKLGGNGCQNLDEMSKRVCDQEINLRDIIIVKDNRGNMRAIHKAISSVHHSER